MSQIFSRSANSISRVSIIGGGLLVGLLLGLVYELGMSPWVTRQNVAREQPIEFRHEQLGVEKRIVSVRRCVPAATDAS